MAGMNPMQGLMNPYQMMRIMRYGMPSEEPNVSAFQGLANAPHMVGDVFDALNEARQKKAEQANMVDAGKLTGNPALAGKMVDPVKALSFLPQQERADADKTKVSTNNVPRGLATLLKSSGLTTAESNRLDSMPSAINIHNQIIDAISAFQNNDPSVAGASVNKYIAAHPDVSGFFQGFKANPNNQAALYDALTRMGAIEQYKLQLGSQAMPNEDAVRENQGMYPSLQEVAAKSPVVAQKLNALVDTTIKPAIEGPMNRLSLMRDPNTGKMPAPVLDTIYNNVQSGYDQLGSKIKTLRGFKAEDGMMQVPPEQSGLTQPGKQVAPVPGVTPSPQPTPAQDNRPPLSSF